jgi:hypothetical protein
MRSGTFVLTAAFVAALAGTAGAQTDTPLTPVQVAIACAPRPSLDGPPDRALHIIGGQDTVAKSVFGNRELLVVDGGTNAGVQLGQQFFVRRASRYPMAMAGYGGGRSATTVGWIRVVAVNDSTAIATVDRACGPISAGDFLETFVVPTAPPDGDRDERAGEPDFTSLARVVIASENHTTAGPGDFVLIDRGDDQGLTAGARVAIYRDIGIGGMPLASIGDGIVISTGSAVALTRITRARGAVFSGDYIAIRK